MVGVGSGCLVVSGEEGRVSAGTTFWPCLYLGVLQPGDYLACQAPGRDPEAFLWATLEHWADLSVTWGLTLTVRERSHQGSECLPPLPGLRLGPRRDGPAPKYTHVPTSRGRGIRWGRLL